MLSKGNVLSPCSLLWALLPARVGGAVQCCAFLSCVLCLTKQQVNNSGIMLFRTHSRASAAPLMAVVCNGMPVSERS